MNQTSFVVSIWHKLGSMHKIPDPGAVVQGAGKFASLDQPRLTAYPASTGTKPVTFEWSRGHAGIEGNERPDQLSQKGAIETCGHVIDFSRFKYK